LVKLKKFILGGIFMNDFLNLRQASNELGYTVDWLRHLIREGRIKAERFGNQYIISRKTFEDFLKERGKERVRAGKI